MKEEKKRAKRGYKIYIYYGESPFVTAERRRIAAERRNIEYTHIYIQAGRAKKQFQAGFSECASDEVCFREKIKKIKIFIVWFRAGLSSAGVRN